MAAAEVAAQGIRGCGITGPAVLKTDNEEAIIALRHRVRALHPGAALEQAPAPHAHESNGVIESGNKVGERGSSGSSYWRSRAAFRGGRRAPTLHVCG